MDGTDTMKVTSAWVDTLAIDDNEQDLVSVESSDRLTFKVIPRNSSEKTLNLSLSIPENVNIRLTAQDLNVCFKNKVRPHSLVGSIYMLMPNLIAL